MRPRATPAAATIALTVVMAVLSLLSIIGPAAAPATAAPGLVAVEITAVSPVNPTPGGTLVVEGVLRNVASVGLRDVGVRLTAGSQPLASVDDAFAVAADSFEVFGQVVDQQQGFVSLQPGGETAFRLTAPLAEMPWSAGAGVYPIAVESVDGAADILGTAVTMTPWFPPGSVTDPVRVVMPWPLVGLPARDADDVFLTTTVAGEFQRDGRLRELLNIGERHADTVSWILDAQTQQSAALLSAPHQQLDAASGAAATQPGDPAGAAWVDSLRQVAAQRDSDLTALGYADPDTVAAVSAGLFSDVVLATTTAADQVSSQIGRTVRSGFSWAPAGRLDQATLNTLRGAGVRAVALSADAVDGPPSAAVVTLNADSGPIQAVIGDRVLSDVLAQLDDPAADPVATRQLTLAVIALTSQFAPGATLVALPETPWWSPDPGAVNDVLTAVGEAEYADSLALGALLDQAAVPGVAPSAELAPWGPADVAATSLPPGQTDTVATAGAALAEIGAIAVQPGDALRPYREALLRSLSTAWHTEQSLGSQVVSRTAAQVAAERAKVTISSAGTVSFPGESGRVPVTVSNDLDIAVTVGLTVTATPAYRVSADPVEPITVPPGQRLSLEVPVTLVGSEPLQVTAQLLTPAGEPYGTGETFTVRTSAYSRVAAWAVGLAFAALVVMAAASVVRRVRQRREPAPSGDEAMEADGGERG